MKEHEIFHQTTTILANEPVAEGIWALRLTSPEIAHSTRPGQFSMLRIPGTRTPLLGRPLAIFRTNFEQNSVEVVYAVVGLGTEQMSHLRPGMEIEIWAPLGNGFPLDPAENVLPTRPLLVAGGIGQTPMYELAKFFLERPETETVTLLMGSRDAAHVACDDAFEALADAYPDRFDFQLSTDDGSRGFHGFVTALLDRSLASGLFTPTNSHVYSCGPKPMLRAVADLAKTHALPCHVSLETPMACGMGICFTCVTKIKDSHSPEGWDYARTCAEGPVFDAEKLVW